MLSYIRHTLKLILSKYELQHLTKDIILSCATLGESLYCIKDNKVLGHFLNKQFLVFRPQLLGKEGHITKEVLYCYGKILNVRFL